MTSRRRSPRSAASDAPGGEPRGELGRIWEYFADTSCRGYAPLYDRVCRTVARDPELLALVQEAPPEAHLPNVLLAAVHYLLLAGLGHPLGDVYAGRSPADPGPLFRALCLDHRAELLALMATRRTQTNECGRCAVLGPAFTWAARRARSPLALVDCGASAGLTLGCDRYLLDYGEAGATGPRDASVRIECAVAGGQPPIEPALPEIVWRTGLDRSPVDVTDPDDARWLLACVWPDTADRLERTRAAIADAQRHPPRIERGDMVDSVGALVAEAPAGALVCVTTTWALAYLDGPGRRRFAEQLALAGRTRPVVWISGEGPGVVEAFAGLERRDAGGIEASVLGASVFDGTHAEATPLAYVHPHGATIDWLVPA